MTPIQILLAQLQRAREWPGDTERAVRALIYRWAAFRDSDVDELRRLARWPLNRMYIVDNLPEKISGAYGNLLYGEDPVIRAANEADKIREEELVRGLPGALQGAVETEVSEGEVWWRAVNNSALGLRPSVTWHSRIDVIPLLAGRDVAAAAFVSMLGARNADDHERVADPQHTGRPCWRHLEIHAAGTIENYLFRGTWTKLGDQQDLGAHPDTADIMPVWDHGLPMLAGRIVNKWGRRPTVGISDFNGVWTQFLVLNEATTIGRENMRLTAKKRAVVPASAITPRLQGTSGIPVANRRTDEDTPNRPSWDAGEDVLIHDPLDTDDTGGKSPFQILEYSFDAQALIAYKRDVAETLLTRCDIVPQFIGSGDFGIGASGTALRVRLLPTINAAEGKARPWDQTLPHILTLLQRLEALPPADHGLGVAWTAPQDPPSVERTSPLPEDENEIASRHATLKTSSLISIYTSVKERHPEWDDVAINAEVERIHADDAATLPGVTFGGTNPPPPGQGNP